MKLPQFLVLFPYYIFSQPLQIEWQNRIGGFEVNLNSVAQHTIDGGYIIGGSSNSNLSGDKTENSRGLFDYWIVKTNNSGIIEWDKTIGGSAPNGWEQDVLTDLKQTLDGGYIICGISDSPISGDKNENSIGSVDFWVVKLNPFGVIEWQNTIGGMNADEPYSILQTIDGGFLVSGQSQSNISGDKSENSRGLKDYWVVKLNQLGQIEWDKTIGGNGNDVISETLQLENGNFILLGFSNSNISGDKTEDSKGSNDYWIIEINSLGEIIWQKTIGGDGSDISTSLIKTTNNTLLLGGHSSSSISGDKTESCRGFSDYWIVELNSSGDILWQKTIGGNQEDKLLAITESNDNNYLITGNSSSGISGDKTDPLYGIGGADSWIVKINTVGNILFQKTIGSTGDDGLNSILQENDGGIFLSGGTNSPSTNDINELPIGINDYWILRLTASLDTPSYPDKAIFSIAPNPTNSNVSLQWQPDGNAITIGLYSPLGQLLSHQNDASGLVAIELPEANGVYILKINTVNDQYYTFKILKM
ncbi:MAG: T9SS type A sorting domain-containing protein [Flavobacterium sp.]|jgi:hypothetical protein|uniref:T9SS type A sorting domain-containing protein n=2 Tax=Flavobacterium sp. TaxID=239 RepID=UPI0022CC8D7B|nr:T9SS type A sorting domain-containing protein [Flavobacterium sp.]MCZ8298288.1 T9SS type A sorting domain-containing protein [Flavobacterium sp.]